MTFGDRKKPMARGKGLAPGKGLARGKPLANRSELKRSAPVVRALPAKPPGKPKAKPTTGKGSPIPEELRQFTYLRDGGLCQRCGVYCLGRSWSIQHRQARGMGGSVDAHYPANLVLLCGSATTLCHGHVESFRTEAEATGWRVPRGVDPREQSCWRFGLRWEQPGELWVPGRPIAA